MSTSPWKRAFGEAAVSGSIGSILSAALLAVVGARQTAHSAAPLNATSQWLWGQHEALGSNDPDRRHTVAGYAIHHAAATFWAVLHARALDRQPAAARPLPALAAATVTGAIAAIVDLKLTPERLSPGFQHRVTPPALVGAYALFALGLALGSVAVRRARRD